MTRTDDLPRGRDVARSLRVDHAPGLTYSFPLEIFPRAIDCFLMTFGDDDRCEHHGIF